MWDDTPSVMMDLLPTSVTPSRTVAKDARAFYKTLPNWSTISENADAMAPANLNKIPGFTLGDKLNYILTGKVPSSMMSEEPGSYSLDVAKFLKGRFEKPKADLKAELSPTMRLGSINNYSNDWNKTFQKKYGKYVEDDIVDFKKLTPEEVTEWNLLYGDIYGIIDPTTRTMPYYVGKKIPNTSK